MRVQIHYWSGEVKDLIAPADMLFSDLTAMAFAQGGKIKNVVYP